MDDIKFIAEFMLDADDITSVAVNNSWQIQPGPNAMVSMRYMVDHPSFAELRGKLAGYGYIETVVNSYNGDVVLKAFKLNGVRFLPGETFYCAGAMKMMLENKRKEQNAYQN